MKWPGSKTQLPDSEVHSISVYVDERTFVSVESSSVENTVKLLDEAIKRLPKQ